MASGTEIGKAFIHIVPSFKGLVGSLQQGLVPGADQAGQAAGASLAGKIKGALIAAGIGKVLGDVVKASLNAGGALQQSFGGLDTLYGDASEAAKKYAMEAAQAGISADTYAQQAVSFGAALKQAFGGDTQKAMEAANTAILDMADNSAKMGTDISSIQAAYQGFAKQNYTMLDNLKLGYGGTKTEMERLLKDAEKLTGIKYDINNLGDVYEAIHVIQSELGIAGVAADEARTTLTGSAQAVKAAWQNVLASMSLGMDLSQPITQLLTSAGDLLIKNIVPMVGNVIRSIPQVAIQVAQQVMPSIQAGIDALLSGQVAETVATLTESFVSRIPELMATGLQMLTGLATGLYNALPQIIVAAANVIAQFVGTIAMHLPEILQKGIEIIGQIAAGLIRAIPQIAAQAQQVISNIKSKFTQFDWASIGRDIINGIVNGIKSAAGAIGSALTSAASSAYNAARNFLKIGSPSKLFADGIGQWIPAGIAEGITDNMGVIDTALANIPTTIANATYAPSDTYSASDDLANTLNANTNVTVVLQGDAGKLFKVVRKENNKFMTSTGQSAFTY